MKKSVTGLLLLAFVFGFLGVKAMGSDLDPGYRQAFGNGAVVISKGGYPAFGKMDPSQFNYNKTTKTFSFSEGDTIDLRAVLPSGKTMGDYINKFKQENPNIADADIGTTYRIWASHDYSGNSLVSKTSPWPKKVSEEPNWKTLVEKPYNAEGDFITWDSSGCTMDELKEEGIATWLEKAQPGWKLYVLFEIEGKSKAAPTIENKWDDIRKDWVPTNVPGLLSYSRLPVVAGTVVRQ